MQDHDAAAVQAAGHPDLRRGEPQAPEEPGRYAGHGLEGAAGPLDDRLAVDPDVAAQAHHVQEALRAAARILNLRPDANHELQLLLPLADRPARRAVGPDPEQAEAGVRGGDLGPAGPVEV